MPANPKQNTPNQDEIDLLVLFSKLGEFIKRAFLGLFNLIISILVFLLRKWYYFLVAVILTVITGITLSKSLDSYYTTDMVIQSNAADNQTIMTSLDVLGGYAREGNYTTLSNELNISAEAARAIKDLETYWFYDIGDDGIYDGIDINKRYLSDTSVVKLEDEFDVRAIIYDTQYLKDIENGLVHYLESNPLFDALNKQRISDLHGKISQTQYEIEKLDSLQKREYYTNPDELRQKDGQIIFTSEKNVQTYHNDMFRLLSLKQNYERELNIYPDVVTVVEGFSSPVKPENGTINYIKKVAWFYIGLALLLAVIITFRKKIWMGSND